MGGGPGSSLAKARLNVGSRDERANPKRGGANEARRLSTEEYPAMLPTTGSRTGRLAGQT